MNLLYFSIADFTFRIRFYPTEWSYTKEKLSREICGYLKGFILTKKPKRIDCSIKFIWQQIPHLYYQATSKESYISLFKVTKKREIICYYRMSIIEFEYVLFRIVTELLTTNNGFVLHASASNINGKADIFLGKSGAGKSTIINLIKNKYSPLADDRLIIREYKDQFFLYQTPFFEKEYRIPGTHEKYSIGKVFILRKKLYYRIAVISNKDIAVKKIAAGLIAIKKIERNKQISSVLRFASIFSNFFYLDFAKDEKKLVKLEF